MDIDNLIERSDSLDYVEKAYNTNLNENLGGYLLEITGMDFDTNKRVKFKQFYTVIDCDNGTVKPGSTVEHVFWLHDEAKFFSEIKDHLSLISGTDIDDIDSNFIKGAIAGGFNGVQLGANVIEPSNHPNAKNNRVRFQAVS